MPRIDTQSVDIMGFRLLPASRRRTVQRRFGADGVIDMAGGWEAPEITGPTETTVADAATRDTVMAAYRRLIGRRVTVIDQFGVVWLNVLVLDVVPEASPRIPSGWDVLATWTLRPDSEGPT